MSSAQFLEVNPVLPVRSVTAGIRYYTDKLGFSITFQDLPKNPQNAVVERNNVRLHLRGYPPQNFRENVEVLNVRFMIDDVDSLYAEYAEKFVFQERTTLEETSWGTREFAFRDLDGNNLIFYRYL